MIILDEEGLRRVLSSYLRYYHKSRLHLSLDKDSPDPRPVQSVGKITAIPEVGGLHHRYERRERLAQLRPRDRERADHGYAHRTECVRHTCNRKGLALFPQTKFISQVGISGFIPQERCRWIFRMDSWK